MISCILLHDSEAEPTEVRSAIRNMPGLLLKGTVSTKSDLIVLLNEEVDLIFYDLTSQQPGIIMELNSLIGLHHTLVILVAELNLLKRSYFDLNVVDFIIKPFQFERFKRAVVKATHLSAQNRVIRSDPDFIFISAKHQQIRIGFSEILFIKGLKDYIRIFLVNRTEPLITRQSLKDMEQILNKGRFIRVHKSYLINLDKITLVKGKKVSLGEFEVPIGASFMANFRNKV